MAEVTYISKRTMVSTKPVKPGKFCRLSVLDRLMEQNQLKIVCYYGTKRGKEGGEITKKLRESFSEILTCFPIMSGRLVRDPDGKWMIKCNDAGVRMVEARARGSVHDWLKWVDREKELKLVHWEDMYVRPYFWSTFYVQITEFDEGGLAIGLSCTHLLADPVSVTKFIKAWADTTLNGSMITPPFFHPLPPRRPGNANPNHIPNKNLINYYKSIFDRANVVVNTNYATVALSFSDHLVRAIMSRATITSAPNQRNISPFISLSALFWLCLSNVKGSNDKLIDMSICLDMRKVLGLDKGFFGNCMVYNKIEIESSNALDSASKAIGETIAKMDNEGIMDLIEWLQYNDQQQAPLMNGCNLICANLEDLEPYATTFEDGYSPIRVSYYVEPVVGSGQILILPSSTEEGPLSRVAMVTLPEDEVVELLEDTFLLQFSPAALMRLK